MFDIFFVFQWAVEHIDDILTVLGAVLALIRLTAWGMANARALRIVTEAIEELKARDIKAAVATKSTELDPTTTDVLADACKAADPNKQTPTSTEILLREALRIFKR